uniref:Reverse transcriptase domain-containing protein n=1 Tax=Tanacetum cinerariifolium TaxID=118510 RepID=A0A6L2J9M4_TANCI|nr:reverse transcriptase domain-containing protein [Tanacetum cinerariifolium]
MAKQHNELKNMMTSFLQMQSPLGSGSLPSNTIANSRGDVKAITTRSGVAYDGPTIPPTPSPLPKEVKRETKPKKEQGASYKFIKLHFDISFTNALLHMPKFAFTFKSLLSTKEKLFELATTPLNENCLAVLLKKLPEKLGDPGNINLMPLSVWKKLSLSKLTPTCMTLELANRSFSYLIGVAKDVFVKVGKFYFPADFVVVDYDVNPRVPLIFGRPFLRTTRALIDVHGEELTLRVNYEAITFKVRHTSSYSRNYYEESVNRIDVTNVSREEYAQEVLGFSNSLTNGNPTPSDPIIASFSLSFTPFEGSDFILEEIETFLRTPDELSNMNDDYYDTEGDILNIRNAENLVADHLSRLENSHEGDLEKKEINETFPLDTHEIIYFMVEAKALPTNDARVVVKFLKSLFTGFGTPRAIISDRGENRAPWSDKLDDVLWALRTAFKTLSGLPCIMKTLVLMVFSIVHSSFNPYNAFIWESGILDLVN